ncbi:MAG: demethylmenaquinone methyltransferase / 2-octaprenyl-6-methoxy,4-benzoquinone methylase [Deltaproteobacteria bacterium]|nr:demethylmenaquinone methyltransferase / 2-octaprenyl-6-methoxy,4-benzoquinone methylase [Deltaproteobacteria bacterium]
MQTPRIPYHDETETDVATVAYGYRNVLAAEKRWLVDRHFDQIARRYDLADALLSFGLHSWWKRFAIRELALNRGDRVLDVCGGTGDFAILAAKAVAPEGAVTVYDINRHMMEAGQRKVGRSGYQRTISWLQGDAEMISFPDKAFDAVTVGFGLRNLIHLERGLLEMFRVLKKGGRLLGLEFSVPRSVWVRALYHFYSFKVIPLAGKAITGTADPFKYLAESIRVFPRPEAMKVIMEDSGFSDVTWQRLTNGIVVVYTGRKSR